MPIKKGKREGITLLNHSKSPVLAEARTVLGNKIIITLKKATKIGIIRLLNFFRLIIAFHSLSVIDFIKYFSFVDLAFMLKYIVFNLNYYLNYVVILEAL